jgi:hypothetical protein
VETDLDEFLADIETERQNRQLGQPNPEKR